MHAIIRNTWSNMKTSKIKQKLKSTKFRTFSAIALVGIIGVSTILPPLTKADTFQDQINALSAENDQKRNTQGILGTEAASLSDAISRLQGQINALQNEITVKQNKAVELQGQIAAAEIELAKQKVLLGETIKAMYLEGDVTTVEMLASSKDLSDFFDKQQYRSSVQEKVKNTLDKVTALKLELATQKETLEKVIKEQQSLKAQLDAQNAEQNRVLALNQQQQNELDSQIKANSSKIGELRAQQRLANLKAGGMANFSACAGGYPADIAGPYGRWGCNYALDNTIDNWGMYNRECVSYTAFKVAASGRYMPYWGGVGNANQWDDNARRMGIPVDGSPRVGDVVVWHIGYYGHVMYVEAVGGDGSILISEYNYDWTGRYSERSIPASQVRAQGLQFIHF
jgi:surface antigen/peptidoglycan hydrolase CwlO-like protein